MICQTSLRETAPGPLWVGVRGADEHLLERHGESTRGGLAIGRFDQASPGISEYGRPSRCRARRQPHIGRHGPHVKPGSRAFRLRFVGDGQTTRTTASRPDRRCRNDRRHASEPTHVSLSLEAHVSREELTGEAMRAADSKPDLRRSPKDLGRHDDERVAKSLPLPADHLGRKRELRDPLAQVPGQARDLQPGAAARKLGHGIAPSRDPAAELRYDLLLVAALVGRVDHVDRRP